MQGSRSPPWGDGRGGRLPFVVRYIKERTFLTKGWVEGRIGSGELSICGLLLWGEKMKADYLAAEEMQHLLAALMPPNRLALEVSMATGLRIGDVLSMQTERVKAAKDGRMSVRESKTGKTRRIRVPVELRLRMLQQAGKIYIWEGRLDSERHRTRQAVYKDLARTAALYRLPKLLHVSPHTARKVYAVEQYQRTGDLHRVQRLLQHDNESVTAIYAMADYLTARKLGRAK